MTRDQWIAAEVERLLGAGAERGTCVDCPRDDAESAHPALCQYRSRPDHWARVAPEALAEALRRALWAGSNDRPRCHAERDGECNWEHCPQARDGEPKKTGRHCPLDTRDDDE